MKYFLAVLLALLTSISIAEVNPTISKALATREISREDAKNIYMLRERSWTDGTKVQVLRLPLRDPVHKAFVSQVLQMSDVSFDKEWKKLVNAGLAPQILEVTNENEMMYQLSKKYNGVGYLSKDYIVLNIGGYDVTVIRIVD